MPKEKTSKGKPKNRFLKLAGMTTKIAGKAVKNRVSSLTSSDEQKAEAKVKLMTEVGLQIADTLGEMKGAVMKVGQIASQYKDVFPPEVSKALEKLQRSVEPMPFSIIKSQVESELGKPINELFQSFDETAFAAASIGQVHKAVLPTGENVVVKVQYPKVDESCESDLKQVRVALKLAGVFKIDKAAQDAIFEEMQNSLHDELDYTKEAHNLKIFRTFHSKIDSGLIIPQVFESHSARRVLTLSEEMGETLETAKNWPHDVKEIIAGRLFHFSASQLFHLRRIHCDPHPGNFAFRENGDVVVYDFGAIRNYSEEDVQHFKLLIRHALKGDVTALEQDLIDLGVRRQDDTLIPSEFYQRWIEILGSPATIKNFDYAQAELHKDIIEQVKKSTKYWNNFQPAPRMMMVDRTFSGLYWNFVNLEIVAPDNAEAELRLYIDA